MGKVENFLRLVTLFIGIMSSIMSVETFYAYCIEVQLEHANILLSSIFMIGAFSYTIFCLAFIKGTLEHRGNWMIPWLIFIPGGAICYSQFFTSLISNTGSELIGLVLFILNWSLAIQLFLSYKNLLRLDSEEDETSVA